jgi:hypothetical protein
MATVRWMRTTRTREVPLQFSVRAIFIVVAVAAVVFTITSGPNLNIVYHSDVGDWHAEDFAMGDGQPHAVVWKKAWTGGNRNFLRYYDQDRDGTIDCRHERQDDYIISTFDDDRDGVFDRESIWHASNGNTVESVVRHKVPRTKANEPSDARESPSHVN